MNTEFFFYFWEPYMNYLIIGINLSKCEKCIIGLLIRSYLEMREAEKFISADML
jgi:hypothetical protein